MVPAGGGPVPEENEAETFDLGTLEMKTIRRALLFTGGQKTKAAELLGINERTLRNKLKAERASA
jgi:DNA-binding protein Fis